jgi:hypothetical protein
MTANSETEQTEDEYRCPECGGGPLLSTNFGQDLYCAQFHHWSPDGESQ